MSGRYGGCRLACAAVHGVKWLQLVAILLIASNGVSAGFQRSAGSYTKNVRLMPVYPPIGFIALSSTHTQDAPGISSQANGKPIVASRVESGSRHIRLRETRMRRLASTVGTTETAAFG